MHLLGVQLLLVLSVVGWSLVTVILGWFGLRVRVFTDFLFIRGVWEPYEEASGQSCFFGFRDFHVFFSFSRIWSPARFLGFMVSGPGSEKRIETGGSSKYVWA